MGVREPQDQGQGRGGAGCEGGERVGRTKGRDVRPARGAEDARRVRRGAAESRRATRGARRGDGRGRDGDELGAGGAGVGDARGEDETSRGGAAEREAREQERLEALEALVVGAYYSPPRAVELQDRRDAPRGRALGGERGGGSGPLDRREDGAEGGRHRARRAAVRVARQRVVGPRLAADSGHVRRG